MTILCKIPCLNQWNHNGPEKLSTTDRFSNIESVLNRLQMVQKSQIL